MGALAQVPYLARRGKWVPHGATFRVPAVVSGVFTLVMTQRSHQGRQSRWKGVIKSHGVIQRCHFGESLVVFGVDVGTDSVP